MGSQRTAEMSVTGVNLTQSTQDAPQIVGPSMSGGNLTDVVDRASNDLPKGILKPNLISERLSPGFVGGTAIPLADPRGIRGISITSVGDVFCHDWFFTADDASESFRQNINSTRLWCLDFQNTKKKKTADVKFTEFACNIFYPQEETSEADVLDDLGEYFAIEDVVSQTEQMPHPVEYFREFYSDARNLLSEDGEVPTALSSARDREEEERQELIDNTISQADKSPAKSAKRKR